LDEVGDMSPLTQSKLLRVLQEQRFERLGGNETIKTDTRVLAATNRDLAALVTRGRFRQDLFYRLSVFTIHLPPVRERGDDLALLVQHYLRRFSKELCKEITGVAPDALEALRQYSWPGNVRELQSVLKQALLQATGTILVTDFLPASLLKQSPSAESPSAEEIRPLLQFIDEQLTAGTENLYEQSLRRMERLLLTRVLLHTHGNQVQASKILGITRGSLRNKLRELGISIARTVEGNDDLE
jgi:two-component system nitrogen regulation response regulator GlnG